MDYVTEFTLDFMGGPDGGVPMRAVVNTEAGKVAFYDRRWDFGPDGQFISGYYLVDALGVRSGSGGFNLSGGVDAWSINAHSWDVVWLFLKHIQEH